MPGALHHLFTTKIEEEPVWSGIQRQFNCGMKGSVLPKLPPIQQCRCQHGVHTEDFMPFIERFIRCNDSRLNACS